MLGSLLQSTTNMKKRILWLEDEGFMISGLFRPLQKEGFFIDNATCAGEAVNKLYTWDNYDLIATDFILPLSNDNDDFEFSELFPDWKNERYIGIELIKYIRQKLSANLPILILTVVRDPSNIIGIQNFKSIFYVSKVGLSPSTLSQKVREILNL